MFVREIGEAVPADPRGGRLSPRDLALVAHVAVLLLRITNEQGGSIMSAPVQSDMEPVP